MGAAVAWQLKVRQALKKGLKWWQAFLKSLNLFLKILSGMANSLDPDQTAPSGAVLPGSALFVYDILPETLCTKF